LSGEELETFGQAGGEIGVERVYNDATVRRDDHQIQVFHGDGAQEDFVPQYDCADVALPVAKADGDGADVWAKLPLAVGGGNFFLRGLFELKLIGDVLRNAEEKGAGVREGFDLDGLEGIKSRVIEQKLCGGETHGKTKAIVGGKCKSGGNAGAEGIIDRSGKPA
jgi:hypothetical protein